MSSQKNHFHHRTSLPASRSGGWRLAASPKSERYILVGVAAPSVTFARKTSPNGRLLDALFASLGGKRHHKPSHVSPSITSDKQGSCSQIGTRSHAKEVLLKWYGGRKLHVCAASSSAETLWLQHS